VVDAGLLDWFQYLDVSGRPAYQPGRWVYCYGRRRLVGAIAILAAHLAQDLGQMVVAQFAAGAAWGAILMSAFTIAFAIGENGGEGRMSGLLFSALALATLTRMATVATGFNADPALKMVLQWMPALCWAGAGGALLYLTAARVKRWVAP
jgi:hypothetical protein